MRRDTPAGGLEEAYVHGDHQGSIDRLTAAGAALTGVTASSFDAFGKRRNPHWTNDTGDSRFNDNHWTEWGYTGHEQLDSVRLTHMNGRMQDPIAGRMLSLDPVIGDLAEPQSLNPYSYVSNNPATLVDPSGFCERDPTADATSCAGGDGGIISFEGGEPVGPIWSSAIGRPAPPE
jgi:RHS repeat-associated protein